jgi:5-methylcytosine-specific restriction endonuclease McrA
MARTFLGKVRALARLPGFPVVDQHKVCNRCFKNKPVTDYYVTNKTTGAFSADCKECRRAAALARKKAKREANPEAYKAAKRQSRKRYRAAHPEKLRVVWRAAGSTPEQKAKKAAYRKSKAAEIKARKAEYRRKNRDRIREYNKQYRAARPGFEVACARRWQSKNPEKFKAIGARASHRRRAREANTVNDLTAEQWQEIIDAQDNRCALCRTQFGFLEKPTRDHVIPLTKGGGLTASNTMALCHGCNASKGNRLVKLPPLRKKRFKRSPTTALQLPRE